MPSKTRSQLIEENAALQTRLAELEAANKPSSKKARPETGENGHKRNEDKLKASEVRYRRLFETAKDGILILDAATGQITDVNPYLEDMLGYSGTELRGKTLWELSPFRDVVANQIAFRQLQNQEFIRYDNLPLETKKGQHKQVEFVSNVYWVDDKRVIQCNIRDITARKQAETDFRKTNEELMALVAELQRRDREMQVLNSMNDLLRACVTQEEAYQVISLTAGELFVGQTGSLAVASLSPSGQYLETVAQWGNEETMAIELTFSLEDCWALRRGQPHEVADPQTGLLCRHFAHPPQSGYLCVPLTVQGETLGVLCLMEITARKDKHRASQQQLAVMVGEAIKLSLSNLKLREKLHDQAMRDPLTGLFNRRYLEETLPRELHRAQRGKSPLCVVMLDLDHFKQFNDTFGHEAGDLLLRKLGQILQESLRKSDIACRQGGDEFLLVLADSTLEGTWKRIEQIRIMVKEIQIRHEEQLIGTMTLSASIVEASDYGRTGGELLRAADKALYAAKQAGRDRVVIYQPSDTGTLKNLPQVAEIKTPQSVDVAKQ
jgi:diguanylate cyclase (GGDEF)-like protein/PAS domain S-box-containing protein